ncbi:MAG: hypothetical protein M1831_004681 [Alyxoria varia]|nr:MAG: hypothetical protein M1831_004681 [Alyxoria varia]
MSRFLLQSARFATRLTVQKPVCLSPSCLIRPSQPIARPIPRISARFYAAGGGLSKTEVEGRIIDLLKGYDKVKDQSQVTPSSNFANDLGLDSLDTVEVVMGVEEVCYTKTM